MGTTAMPGTIDWVWEPDPDIDDDMSVAVLFNDDTDTIYEDDDETEG